MNYFLRFITKNFKAKKNYKIQSFTYYIPAPPPRSTGYREKQFDKIFYDFINKGYEIINFTTQMANSGENSSGMWVICLVRAISLEADSLNFDDFIKEAISRGENKIEGLYYIDDEANGL